MAPRVLIATPRLPLPLPVFIPLIILAILVATFLLTHLFRSIYIAYLLHIRRIRMGMEREILLGWLRTRTDLRNDYLLELCYFYSLTPGFNVKEVLIKLDYKLTKAGLGRYGEGEFEGDKVFEAVKKVEDWEKEGKWWWVKSALLIKGWKIWERDPPDVRAVRRMVRRRKGEWVINWSRGYYGTMPR